MKCKHKESTINRDGKECLTCGLNWYQCLKDKRQEKKSKFPPDLVKEYGEQTYRDKKSTGAKRYKDAAWSSAYVAEACGYITEKEIPRFLEAITNYAKTTKFPKNFI